MESVSMAAAGNLRSVGAQKVGFSGKQLGFKAEEKPDSVEIKSKELPPPKIGGLRLFFGLLTDKQINQINESKKLPDNAKFIMNGYGGYRIALNIFGITAGTKTVPDDFEVKKGLFGFAAVVPKGTEGLFIKDAKKT